MTAATNNITNTLNAMTASIIKITIASPAMMEPTADANILNGFILLSFLYWRQYSLQHGDMQLFYSSVFAYVTTQDSSLLLVTGFLSGVLIIL